MHLVKSFAGKSDEEVMEIAREALRDGRDESVSSIARGFADQTLANAVAEMRDRDPDNKNPVFRFA